MSTAGLLLMLYDRGMSEFAYDSVLLHLLHLVL